MSSSNPNRRGFLATVAAGIFLATNARAQWNDLLKKSEGLFTSDDEEASGPPLTSLEIDRGLKEALRVGAKRVITRVGRVDGYNDDPEIHIPLPTTLRSVKYAFRHAGVPGALDGLELRINRAAEAAAPKAKRIFSSAIRQMTLEDARRIYKGQDDAATQYFKKRMTPDLTEEMRPVIDSSMSEVGAYQSYNEAMDLYNKIPIAPKINPDLTGHVVEKAIEGIFYYLAKEEAEIRKNPVKRTTKILQRVFGAA